MNSIITFIAQYLILLPVLVIIDMFFGLPAKRRRQMLFILLFMGILSLVLAKIAAHLYDDPRPYISDGAVSLFSHGGDPNGFPSDHTLLAAFLGFGALIYHRKTGIGLLIIAALIGWARVAAHVHHAADIIGSFIVTFLAYLTVTYLLHNKKLRQKFHTNTHNSHT